MSECQQRHLLLNSIKCQQGNIDVSDEMYHYSLFSTTKNDREFIYLYHHRNDSVV